MSKGGIYHSLAQLPDLDRFTAVSFDCWDTLVTRAVGRPHDVFAVVELAAREQGLAAQGFASHRVQAERRTRRAHRGREITLAEIYTELARWYAPETCEALRQLELDTEYELVLPCKEVVKFFRHCLQAGKRVFIISDMYLSAQETVRLLAKCGVTGYEAIFVSADYGVTKWRGELYDTVAAQTGLKLQSWIHVGDNPRSDGQRAAEHGLQACLVSPPQALGDYLFHAGSSLFDRTVLSLVHKCPDIDMDQPLERLGAEVYGPTLQGFTFWLQARLERDGVRQVLFCARDAYYMQLAFQQSHMQGVKARYFLVSRKSLMRPLLASVHSFAEYKQIMWLNCVPRRFTIRFFLDLLQIDNLPAEVMGEYTYDTVLQRSAVTDDGAFAAFFMRVRQCLLADSIADREALFVYMRSLGIDWSRPVALVDLGWYGSTQAVLEKIFSHPVWGYYMGFFDTTLHFQHAVGYLGSSWQDTKRVSMNTSLLELVFSAPHGTLLRYQLQENGRCRMHMQAYEHAAGDEQARLEAIRRGMVRAAAFTARFPVLRYVFQQAGLRENPLMRFGWHPSYRGTQYFQGITFEDNGKKYFCAARSITYYLMHPVAFAHDCRNTIWRAGFLVSLFHVDLSFYYVIRILQLLKFYLQDRRRLGI